MASSAPWPARARGLRVPSLWISNAARLWRARVSTTMPDPDPMAHWPLASVATEAHAAQIRMASCRPLILCTVRCEDASGECKSLNKRMHKDTPGTDSCGAKPAWAKSTHELGTHVDGSTNVSADKHEALTTFHWTTFHSPGERPNVFADLCRHSSVEFGPVAGVAVLRGLADVSWII